MNRDELYSIAENWFHNQGWKSFPFQTQTWTAFLQGKNGLLNAPTGSGKTYALWFPIVLDYIKKTPEYKTKHKPGLLLVFRSLQIDSEKSYLVKHCKKELKK